MKRKNIFIIVLIVILLAVLIPTIIFSIDISTQPKILTIDILEDEFTIEELIEDTPLIIKGTVLNSTIDTNPNNPRDINTIWNIRVSEVLKGDYSESHIDVKQRGGETSTHVLEVVDTVKLVSQEKVILFLGKSPGSSYGDSYYMVSDFFGKYTVKYGQLTNNIFWFNTSEKDIRNKIQASLQ